MQLFRQIVEMPEDVNYEYCQGLHLVVVVVNGLAARIGCCVDHLDGDL